MRLYIPVLNVFFFFALLRQYQQITNAKITASITITTPRPTVTPTIISVLLLPPLVPSEAHAK